MGEKKRRGYFDGVGKVGGQISYDSAEMKYDGTGSGRLKYHCIG